MSDTIVSRMPNCEKMVRKYSMAAADDDEFIQTVYQSIWSLHLSGQKRLTQWTRSMGLKAIFKGRELLLVEPIGSLGSLNNSRQFLQCLCQVGATIHTCMHVNAFICNILGWPSWSSCNTAVHPCGGMIFCCSTVCSLCKLKVKYFWRNSLTGLSWP